MAGDRLHVAVTDVADESRRPRSAGEVLAGPPVAEVVSGAKARPRVVRDLVMLVPVLRRQPRQRAVLGDLAKVGWKPVGLIVAETVFVGLLVLGGLSAHLGD